MASSIDSCRRPITPDEAPYLAALGRVLRSWRTRAGLTQTELADRLAMSRVHVYRLEAGRRRTRQSTLEHIAHAIAWECRRRGHDVASRQVLSELLTAGGSAVAPETARSAGSVERKLGRRRREALRADLRGVAEMLGRTIETSGPEYLLRRRLNDVLGQTRNGGAGAGSWVDARPTRQPRRSTAEVRADEGYQRGLEWLSRLG